MSFLIILNLGFYFDGSFDFDLIKYYSIIELGVSIIISNYLNLAF